MALDVALPNKPSSSPRGSVSRIRFDPKVLLEHGAIFLVSALIFILIANSRLIARDEGFYLIAARLVAEGKKPYIDFFYPQMPLLPYLYGAWMKLTGFSWESGRLLSALLTSSIATLIYFNLHNFGRLIACAAVLCFTLSGFNFPWFTTVLTYAPSTLFLLIAYSFIYLPARLRSGHAVLSGFFFAAACLVRLPFGVTLPILMYLVIRRSSIWYRGAGLFLLGGIIASLPFVPLVLLDPYVFWFNNIGYHLTRSDLSPDAALAAKMKVIQVVTGLRPTKKFVGIDFPLLLWATVLLAFLRFAWRRELDGALSLAIALSVASLVPTPIYVQYFSVTTPFLLISCFTSLATLTKTLRLPTDQSRQIITGILPLSLVGAVLVVAPIDLDRYLRTGVGVMGLGERRHMPNWEIQTVDKLGKLLDLHDLGSRGVVTFWPGYLVSSKWHPRSGLENQFGILTANRLEEQTQRRKFKVLSQAEAWQSLVEDPALLVLDLHGLTRGTKARLRKYGLILTAQEEKIGVFKQAKAETPPRPHH
jgi:Dolichyl-phosphate-mannose-protein mannosyltransferase